MSTVNGPSGRGFSRRSFLSNTSVLGAVALLGLSHEASAEASPEIRKIRLVKVPAICLAPEYLAEELLRLEGFSEVEYVEIHQTTAPEMLVANRADITAWTPPALLADLDTGKPMVALAGIHGGCNELFASDRIRTVRDLKDKRIAVSAIGAAEYYFVSAMVAYVGIDPKKEIEWVEAGYDHMMQYFVDGKVDAVLAFPPHPQEFRAKRIGRLIVDTGQDKPWSQYYCCIITARNEFVAKYPIATKRAVRAILKATDICAQDPERAARYMVANGYESRYEVALEVVKSLTYNRWRTYDAEDSLRFFGVRLHEAGLIRTAPHRLIAQGTDWRFLQELKRELKA
jgi:NitT/TauT family transport system substrate-binding protein